MEDLPVEEVAVLGAPGLVDVAVVVALPLAESEAALALGRPEGRGKADMIVLD